MLGQQRQGGGGPGCAERVQQPAPAAAVPQLDPARDATPDPERYVLQPDPVVLLPDPVALLPDPVVFLPDPVVQAAAAGPCQSCASAPASTINAGAVVCGGESTIGVPVAPSPITLLHPPGAPPPPPRCPPTV